MAAGTAGEGQRARRPCRRPRGAAAAGAPGRPPPRTPGVHSRFTYSIHLSCKLGAGIPGTLRADSDSRSKKRPRVWTWAPRAPGASSRGEEEEGEEGDAGGEGGGGAGEGRWGEGVLWGVEAAGRRGAGPAHARRSAPAACPPGLLRSLPLGLPSPGAGPLGLGVGCRPGHRGGGDAASAVPPTRPALPPCPPSPPRAPRAPHPGSPHAPPVLGATPAAGRD